MTLVHILQGLNLLTFIVLAFQIRMLVKSRKDLISLSEKLMADLGRVSILLTEIEKMKRIV